MCRSFSKETEIGGMPYPVLVKGIRRELHSRFAMTRLVPSVSEEDLIQLGLLTLLEVQQKGTYQNRGSNFLMFAMKEIIANVVIELNKQRISPSPTSVRRLKDKGIWVSPRELSIDNTSNDDGDEVLSLLDKYTFKNYQAGVDEIPDWFSLSPDQANQILGAIKHIKSLDLGISYIKARNKYTVNLSMKGVIMRVPSNKQGRSHDTGEGCTFDTREEAVERRNNFLEDLTFLVNDITDWGVE